MTSASQYGCPSTATTLGQSSSIDQGMRAIGLYMQLGLQSVQLQQAAALADKLTVTVLLLGTIYYDFRFRLVPNQLIVGALAVGLFLRGSEGVTSLVHSLFWTIALSWPFFEGYRRRRVGGGDVKLIAAVSLLSGSEKAAAWFLAGTAAGGLVSLLALLFQRGKKGKRKLEISKTADSAAVTVPYAAAYSLGILVFEILNAVAGSG